MRRHLLLLAPVVLLVLAGCGGTSDDGPGSGDAPAAGDGGADPAAGGISQPENDLQVEIDLGDGSAPQTWTLTCAGLVEGTHPAAQAACDHLDGLEQPFAPLDPDLMCSQQYGGPQTAQVRGRWGGEPVDLELSRVDGCRIAQWDALVPVLPAPES